MNTRKDRAYTLLVLAILCAEAEAQRAWKVSWGDPAADFTDFPPAVAAAKSGDTIFVYDHPSQPTGHTYTAAAIDKPLAVVGLYPGSSVGAPNPTFAGFKGLFRIRGIPAGKRVVLSNIALVPNYVFQWLPMPPHGIFATDCDGDIVLEDLWYETMGGDNARFRFERCRNVVLRGCEIYPGANR